VLARRDEVIAHVYETYGHDRVAMISTHATLGARSCLFRETAKALGHSNDRVNALASACRAISASRISSAEAPAGIRAGSTGAMPPLAEALSLAERHRTARRATCPFPCGGIGHRRPAAHPLTCRSSAPPRRRRSRSSRCAPSRRSCW
jgi:hypothetical protein